MAIHDIARGPRGQACVSSGRFVTCAQAAARTRGGTAGKNIGNAHLPWAFAEAAGLLLRNHPAGHTSLARLENTHDPGHALIILAQPLARTVYDRLTRQTACALEPFRHGAGRSAGAPGASRDTPGMSLKHACALSRWPASVHAQGRIGRVLPEPWAWLGHLRWLLHMRP